MKETIRTDGQTDGEDIKIYRAAIAVRKCAKWALWRKKSLINKILVHLFSNLFSNKYNSMFNFLMSPLCLYFHWKHTHMVLLLNKSWGVFLFLYRGSVLLQQKIFLVKVAEPQYWSSVIIDWRHYSLTFSYTGMNSVCSLSVLFSTLPSWNATKTPASSLKLFTRSCVQWY